MKPPRYARISARLLAAAPETRAEVTDSQRARAVARISSALAAKTRRRIRLGWGLSSLGALAAAVLGYFVIHQVAEPTSARPQRVSAVVVSSGSGNAISNQSGSQPLVDAAALPQGGRLVAGASGGATVRLSSGTELSVEHDTNVEFEDAGPVQRFFLGQGVLHAKVAKLSGGQRFIVRTPDAEVEVRGTVFQVAIVDPEAVPCAGGARTRVTVSEGLVEVRGAGASTYVHPGESWPAGCTVAAPALSQSAHAAAPNRVEPEPGPVAPSRSALANADGEASTPSAGARVSKEPSNIARQNELFALATAQNRSGDREAALSSFEALLQRYPQSPLAESASVQRMRLLEMSNPQAAKNAARQYLARYPQGYARTDAARIAQP